MATPSRRSLALTFQPRPFSRRWFQPPEVIVMIERPLLGRRELAAKEVYSPCITTSTPSMSASWKRTVGTGDKPPLAPVDEIDKEIIKEGG